MRATKCFRADSVVVQYHNQTPRDFAEELEIAGIANAIYVEDMRATPSNQGHGSKALGSFLSRFAHRNILLQAYPLDVQQSKPEWLTLQERLIRWYARFGFTHTGGGWLFRKATT